MKKILSLVLALLMVLGLSVTAFATTEYDLKINDVQVTAEGEITNAAITGGTVTYTAAKDGAPAKLTLNGATIVSTESESFRNNDAFYIEGDDIVIELIGENSVSSGAWPFFFGGNATFIGSGSLSTSSAEPGLYFCKDVTFSMGGTVTTNDSNNTGIYCEGSIYLTAGAGKVISHGKDNIMGAIAIDGYGAVVGCKSITGSAENNATADEATAPATISDSEDWKVSKLVGSEAIAHTIVLTAYPFPVSGSTTITANVADKRLSYEIVIPQTVTMNEAGVKEIGAASISIPKLKNATANTVISYTASGTQFKLSTDESKTMAATYYSAYMDEDTNTVLDSTKAIDVYKNSDLVNPLTILYVGVSQTDWDTAAKTNPGTYTATVTYNFSAEEVEKKFETVGEVLETVEGGFPTYENKWENERGDKPEPSSAYKSESNILSVGNEYRAWIPYGTLVSESQTTPGDYVAVYEEYDSRFQAYMAWTITFHMTDNVLTSIDAHLEYHIGSSGEKTGNINNFYYTNIKPVVGEPK